MAWALAGWGPWHAVLPAGIALTAVVVSRQRGGPLGLAVTASAGMAGLAIMIDRCLHATFPGPRQQYSDLDNRQFSEGLLGFGVVLAGAIILCSLGLALARRPRQPARAWAVASSMATAAVLALVVAGSVRALHRPPLPLYVDSLPMPPVQSEVTSEGKTRVVFEGGRWAGWGCETTAFEDVATPVGTVAWHLQHTPGRALVPAPDDPPEPPPPVAHVQVRRDASHGLTIVTCATSLAAPMAVVAHMPNEDFNAIRLASSLGPPWAWVLVAAGGLLLGAAFLAYGARELQQLRAWRVASPGVHHGDGRVDVEGHGSMLIPAAAARRAGPVLVRFDATPRPGTYREGASAEGAIVVIGPLAELESWLLDRATGAFAVATIVTLSAATPLAVAAVHGLL
jgi:hypothetical protein